MSDSEGDFSDELLELAGATEKKRRKRQSQSKPMKRRRASDVSDSDSEQAGSTHEEENENPYPLEGKYTDEEDRERLLSLAEIERENILAQRQEEMQRIQDKRNLDQMFRDRTGGADDSVSKAAKRQHAQRGATKEKSRKLDELKAKRKAKGEKKRTRNDSPRRDRSSSPMDMEMSDEEEEDGQISKFEEDDDKDRSLDKSKIDDGPITVSDLSKAQLTRDTLARHWHKPWFDELIKGGWVRYSCGYDKDRNMPIYRLCEILQLLPRLVKAYPLAHHIADQELLLKHVDQERGWPMDKVSNSAFTEKEFQKLKSAMDLAELALPTRRELEKKAAQIRKIDEQSLTEADISAMLAKRKQESAGRMSVAAVTLEKSRLNQARTLALRRKDFAEVAELEAKLTVLTGKVSQTASPAPEPDATEKREERARIEAMRKLEQQVLERRRKERKERYLAVGAEGTATPTLNRVKVLGTLDSRPGTPDKASNGTIGSPATDSKVDFEAAVLDSVEIDLGDF